MAAHLALVPDRSRLADGPPRFAHIELRMACPPLSAAEIMAGLCVVLSAHTGQDEVLLALPSLSGTTFVTITTTDLTFAELVARCAHAEPIAAVENPVVSLSIAVGPAGEPLDASLAGDVQPLGVRSLGASGADQLADARPSGAGPLDADIALVVSTGETWIDVVARYAGDRYDGARVTAIIRQWGRVLSAAHADPNVPVSDLSVLDDAERRALLEIGTGSALAQPEVTLTELVAAQVRATPDAIAAVCAGETLTYRDLDDRSGALARYLRERGAGPGIIVAGVFDRGLHTLVAILGALRAGAAYTPIDPGFPADRIAFVLRDTGAPIVLTRAAFADGLPALDGVEVLRLDADRASITASTAPDPDLGPDELAFVLFTSGSTGTPKGVELTHGAIVTYLTWMIEACGIGPGSRVLGACSPVFDLSVGETFSALTTGGRLVIATGDEVIEPGALTELIADQRVTHTFTPPTLLSLVDPAPCHDLRCVLLCGEVLPPDLMIRWLDAGARVLNLYGPAETAIACTVHECTPDDAGSAVPIGKPMPGRIARVVDGHGRLVPIGVIGELVIGGAGVARGYRNRPELTAHRFVPDPFGAAPSYRTGDLARWNADGDLEFFGRVDTQVKINGVRIELGEIESVLASHPDIGRAVVVVGDGTTRLVAHLIAAGDTRPDIASLRAFAGRSLPAYMLPTSVRWLDAFPLGATGKVDRRALASSESAPEVAPLTNVSSLVSWALGLASVGSDDDFFSLGGSSLDAARLSARLGMSVSQIYRTPTVAGLEEWLSRQIRDPEGLSSPENDNPSGASTVAPLMPGQANMVGVDGRVVCPLTWWIDGPLDIDALRAALGDVHRRHQALHARYVPGTPPTAQLPGDSWAAQLASDLLGARPASDPLAAPVLGDPRAPELHVCEAAADEGEALRRVDEIVQQPLDITAGRVWRAALVPVPDRRTLFGIGVHHVAFDGPSQVVIARDLTVAYEARRTGSAPSWGAAPTLSEMACASVQAIDDVDRQRAYWLSRLRTVRRLDLPGVGRGPLATWGPKDGRIIDIPGDALVAWHEDARRRGTTRFGYLAAVFGRVLATITGQSDVAMMVPIARRGNAVLDEAVGCRLDGLCLRLPSADGDDWLARAAEAVSEAMGAQDLPFAEVVGALARVRPDLHVLFTLPTFALQDQQCPALELPGVRTEPVVDRFAKEVPTALTVEVFPTPEGATVRVTVRTDHVPIELADRVAETFRDIIKAGPQPK